MIKKTLYFENPSYIKLEQQQLVVNQKQDLTQPDRKIPVEDIGVVVFDHPQITTTQGIISALLKNNACIIYCDDKHMPLSMTLPLYDNDTYSEKVKYQIQATEPLKKQLWKQTVSQKIFNQAQVLKLLGLDYKKIERIYPKVVSGDSDNMEGYASALYWEQLLKPFEVKRGRYEDSPNHFFNYGYAILRSVIARSLVGSGCLPVLGIHHHNKYNPYCLADDIMEPYRPIVDLWIMRYLLDKKDIDDTLSKEDKIRLLQVPVLDIMLEKRKSPLMVGSQRTTASLVRCYAGETRKVLYPSIDA
jgi:CRISP-associated protein Cas1